MDPETPSYRSSSGLSPSIEIFTTDETTQVMSVEEAGAHLEVLRLGPYELGRCIGKGGMAVVYKAKVVGPFGFEKHVVVKRLQPALTARPEFFELFTQEARITAQLGHPGIVQVHDFGVVDGAPFLVMEFIDGVNLAQVVKRLDGERLPVDVAVVVITQVCHALGYAHRFRDPTGVRRQVIHGDVSPSNIMVCRDGTAKLLDFGVAKLLGEFDFELPPMLTGKSAYMAPEQLRREPFDRRVDVFAAGIVLHELLTGRRLFAARNEVETLHRVLAGEIDRPSRWNPAVPPRLDEVALRALARDPGERFESGEEMARALESACRVSGGRRRVSEYFEALFAQPGECDPSDGTVLMSLEPSPAPLPPPPLPPVRMVAEPFRPQSITEMVRPLAPPKRGTPGRRQPIALGLMALVVGFAGALTVPWWLRVAPPRPAPASRSRHRVMRRIDPSIFREVALAPEDAAIAAVTVDPPAEPAPRATLRRKPAVRRVVTPPEQQQPAVHEEEAPKTVAPARVKDGRLLDPFGGNR